MAASDAQGKDFVSKARLEFLSEGVFAIAMTILVIEIKIPELSNPRSARELLGGLRHEWYVLFGWMLSVVVLGLLWAGGHRLSHHVVRVTRAIFACNLLLMASAAFLPFCVGVFARYPSNAASYFLYFGTLELYMLGLAAQLAIAKRQGALDPALTPASLSGLRRRSRRAVLMPLLVLALCLFRFWPHSSAH